MPPRLFIFICTIILLAILGHVVAEVEQTSAQKTAAERVEKEAKRKEDIQRRLDEARSAQGKKVSTDPVKIKLGSKTNKDAEKVELEQQRINAENKASELAEQERFTKIEAERVAAEKVEQDRLEKEETDRSAAEELEQLHIEEELLAKEEAELEHLVMLENARRAEEEAEVERLKVEADPMEGGDNIRHEDRKTDAAEEETEGESVTKIEDERVAAENAEQERLVKLEADRIAAESAKAEADRIAAENAKAEADRIAAESAKAEADRITAESAKAEADRIAAENAKEEADRIAAENAKAEADRIAAENAKAEADRIAAENAKAEADRIAAEQAELERLAKVEADRIAAEKAEKKAESQRGADELARKLEAERAVEEREKWRVEADKKATEVPPSPVANNEMTIKASQGVGGYHGEIKAGLKQCKFADSQEDEPVNHVLSITATIEWRKKIARAMQQQSLEGLSCSDLEYVNSLLSLEKSLQAADSSKPKLPKFSDAENDMSYQALFENLVMENKIFKSKFSPELNYFVQNDFSEYYHHVVESSRDAPLHKLLGYGEDYLSVKAPKIVVNNYIWRILGMAQTIEEDDSLNLLTHWPSVGMLKAGTASSAYTCPLNLNQVIWGIEGSQDLKVRIFSHSSISKLGPILGNRYSALFNTSLHYVNFEKNGFNDVEDASIKFRDVSLSKGEYLFVPHSYPVSFKSSSEEGGKSSAYLRACIVDASNLNLFRESLARYQSISIHYNQLLKALQSMSLSMIRAPNDLSLSDILKLDIASEAFSSGAQVAPEKEKEKKDRRQRKSKGSDLRDWQDAAKWNGIISSLTMQRPSHPIISEITRLGGKVSWTSSFSPNAKDQSIFGFNLTVCEVEAGEENFKYLVENKPEDLKCQFLYAYRVTDKDTPEANKILLQEPTVTSASSVKNYHAIVKSLEHSKLYKIKANTVYTTFQSASSDWSETFQTRAISPPAPIPCFEAKAPVVSKGKTTTSISSINSKTFCINAKSKSPTEASITFRQTTDDGGSKLFGYFVYALEVTEEHHIEDIYDEVVMAIQKLRKNAWRLVAFVDLHKHTNRLSAQEREVLTVTVAHLFPGTSYQFTIVAASATGNSTHSGPSELVTTQVPIVDNERPKLLGNFHSKHTLRDYHVSAGLDTRNKVVHISDLTQQLIVRNYEAAEAKSTDVKSFSVWRSHFSPNYLDIEGDCVILRNYSSRISYKNLNRRIVMVVRDRISPFHRIAQSLQRDGALGVIIADNGPCLEYDQLCVPFANKHLNEFFGQFDPLKLWKGARLPLVLALKSVSDYLVSEGVCVEYNEDVKDEL